jgi:hypothetical protein
MARTRLELLDYEQCVEFARELAARSSMLAA